MFELWDAELGVCLATFESELEALAAVRRLCAQSAGSRAPLGLIQDGRTVLATGEALVERAATGAGPRPGSEADPGKDSIALDAEHRAIFGIGG